MNEREAFEAWLSEWSAQHPCQQWTHFSVWQAACQWQREQDAKACDGISDEFQRREGTKYAELRTDAESGARECAAAIRAADGER